MGAVTTPTTYRLVLMRRRTIGELVIIRDYEQRHMVWRHYPKAGQWVAMEGRKKIARITQHCVGSFALDYAFEMGENARISGGSHGDSVAELKGQFERIYAGGTR